MPPGHFGALLGKVGVVQLLDLLRDRQHRLAPRHHLTAQKAGAAENLLGRCPVEQRIERLPIVIELRLQAEDLIRVWLGQVAELRHRRHVRLAELGQALAVLRRMLARDVEKVVPHKHAGEIDVGPQAPELDVHIAILCVELIELCVDLLCFARCGEHRHGNQQQKTSNADRRHRPRREPHHAPPNGPLPFS